MIEIINHGKSATLEFDLTDEFEAETFHLTKKASDMHAALFTILYNSYLRRVVRGKVDIPEGEYEVYEKVYDEILAIVHEYHLGDDI